MPRNIFVRIPTPHDLHGEAGLVVKQRVVRRGIDVFDPLVVDGMNLACEVPVPFYDEHDQEWQQADLTFKIGCYVAASTGVRVHPDLGCVLVAHEPKTNEVSVSWQKHTSTAHLVRRFGVSNTESLDAAARHVAECLQAWRKWAIGHVRRKGREESERARRQRTRLLKLLGCK